MPDNSLVLFQLPNSAGLFRTAVESICLVHKAAGIPDEGQLANITCACGFYCFFIYQYSSLADARGHDENTGVISTIRYGYHDENKPQGSR